MIYRNCTNSTRRGQSGRSGVASGAAPGDGKGPLLHGGRGEGCCPGHPHAAGPVSRGGLLAFQPGLLVAALMRATSEMEGHQRSYVSTRPTRLGVDSAVQASGHYFFSNLEIVQ